jgi:hypothetical protein
MSDLFTLLAKIKSKPAMYLGQPSVADLFMFLAGYKSAKLEMGIAPSAPELRFYREFQPWLTTKYQITTNKSWAKILQFYTPDDRSAFEQFFDLLDEFQAALPLPTPELVA